MKNWLTLLFIVIVLQGFNQNLVLNNEFEDTTFCPTGLDQLNASTGWRSYSGTADYFHTCAFSMFSRVPSNFFGYQQPSSGKAYASFYAYYTSYPNYREVVGSTLGSPLVPGTRYHVSFKVALANSHDYSRVCNNLGMRFTNWDYWVSYPVPINNWAHMYSTAMISDTLNWTTIAGSFVADSAYTRVMVGNFFDDANTTHVGDATQYGAYYFLDDICVSTDSVFCYTYLGAPSLAVQPFVQVAPNPFEGSFVFSTDREWKNSEWRIYDITGGLVRIFPYAGRTQLIQRESLSAGLYFYQLISDGRTISQGKLVAR